MNKYFGKLMTVIFGFALLSHLVLAQGILTEPVAESVTSKELKKVKAEKAKLADEKAAERRARQQKEAEAANLAEKNRALEQELARMKAADKAKAANEAKIAEPSRIPTSQAPLAPPTFLPKTYTPDPTKLASASRFTVVKSGECIKDNETGLLWELKSKDGGMRDWEKSYTNHEDGRGGDASEYVKAVNAQGLCGYRDWRLPSARELVSLVYCSSGKTRGSYDVGDGGAKIVNRCDGDYTIPTTHPALVDNTKNWAFWTVTKYAYDSSGAWVVDFSNGSVDYLQRTNSNHVRLVR